VGRCTEGCIYRPAPAGDRHHRRLLALLSTIATQMLVDSTKAVVSVCLSVKSEVYIACLVYAEIFLSVCLSVKSEVHIACLVYAEIFLSACLSALFVSESGYESRRKVIIGGYTESELSNYIVHYTVFHLHIVKSYRHSKSFCYGVAVKFMFK
jgi:hypothetical protein